MTIVAGCSLFRGVLIAADCRATIFGYGRDVHVDALQKLFPISSHAVIGFSGDVVCASALLHALWNDLRRNPRRASRGSFALLNRLPRFFGYHYGRLKRRAPVEFMVAGVIPGRNNVIERQRAADLMERFRLGKLFAQRNWMPDILMRVLMTPADATHIQIGPPFGLLFVMRSPDFIPHAVPALGMLSIGSGQSAAHFDREADLLLATHVGERNLEASTLQQSVARCVHEGKVDSVGGLFPCFSIDEDGVRAHGFEAEIPIGGEKIRLEVEDNRWIQHHVNSSTRVPLKYPWELDLARLRTSSTFDFLRSAQSAFTGTP